MVAKTAAKQMLPWIAEMQVVYCNDANVQLGLLGLFREIRLAPRNDADGQTEFEWVDLYELSKICRNMYIFDEYIEKKTQIFKWKI